MYTCTCTSYARNRLVVRAYLTRYVHGKKLIVVSLVLCFFYRRNRAKTLSRFCWGDQLPHLHQPNQPQQRNPRATPTSCTKARVFPPSWNSVKNSVSTTSFLLPPSPVMQGQLPLISMRMCTHHKTRRGRRRWLCVPAAVTRLNLLSTKSRTGNALLSRGITWTIDPGHKAGR